jgi:uncharacterized protein
MKPLDIIARYYDPKSKAYDILVQHGRQVKRKALAVAARVPDLHPDADFIEAAAILHDIGIIKTDSPQFGCRGKDPYIRHGVLGAKLLNALSLPKFALVCERHVGVGISMEDIRQYHLPLPKRDLLPVSIEEKIICYADKFFSKDGNSSTGEKSVTDIVQSLGQYGQDKVGRFMNWVEMFE